LGVDRHLLLAGGPQQCRRVKDGGSFGTGEMPKWVIVWFIIPTIHNFSPMVSKSGRCGGGVDLYDSLAVKVWA
ncbi:UNVERIFIED_CONTAM: hypothetical protein Slati_2910000, partial [Sesamum latifolium]